MRGTNRNAVIWRSSLEQIELTVSAQLGQGRVTGNEQGPCFSRQISMYLAKHVGGWSMVKIGRFYNGRHHTTVMHAVQKVERLRACDESVDELIEVLAATLREDVGNRPTARLEAVWPTALIETVATLVLRRIEETQLAQNIGTGHCTDSGTYWRGETQ